MEIESKGVKKCYYFLKTYSLTLSIFFIPIILIPILITEYTKIYRNIYLLLLMTLFWIIEPIPKQITALIPVLLTPLFNIMHSNEVCLMYLSSGVLTVLSNLMLGLVGEYSNIYTRLALWIVLKIGCSVRKLTFFIMFITMLFSLFMNNWAIASLLTPLGRAILTVLETEKVIYIFYPIQTGQDDLKRPTPYTLSIFLGIAYSATLGGMGSLLGSGIVRLIKKRIEIDYAHNTPLLNNWSWMLYHVPLMLTFTFISWLWLQVVHTGMFRSKSEVAKICEISKQTEKTVIENIREKLHDLGKLTSHEIWVGSFLIIIYLLHVLEDPFIFAGWRSILKKVNPASLSVLFIILFFILPAKWNCLNFIKTNSIVPNISHTAMIIWKYINENLPWSIIFIIGSGYALNKSNIKSELDRKITDSLENVSTLPPFFIILILSLFSAVFSNLGPESISANIIFRASSKLAKELQIHPYYFLIPTMVSSTFAFMLPAGTPPNAISSIRGHIKATQMIISGIVPTILAVFLNAILFPTYGVIIYPEIKEFPPWGNSSSSLFHKMDTDIDPDLDPLNQMLNEFI